MATSIERVTRLLILLSLVLNCVIDCQRVKEKDIPKYRQRVLEMFHHAYDGYIKYAYPYDELRPLTCDGHDTWGSFSLTLIDGLSTLAVMGNYTEFRRVAKMLVNGMDFDIDINASVFETNIRILGGLLSAHLLSKKAGMDLEPGWPCTGPLLRMADVVGRKLLPAFDTPTGMPYGTINLKYGVPKGETTVTCTAGVGTFIVEFGTLSRLTGDPVFEKVAMRALRALWERRSELGLVGNHIDISTGKWTALDAGIGGGIDSYFEYLAKGGIMFQIPELLEQFHAYSEAAEKHLKRDDWYMWANMKKGGITLPMFTSLDGYYPGVQSMLGDIDKAMKTMHNFHQVARQFGFPPEYYNIPRNEAHKGREGYPLRPELIESAVYLYRATKDPFLLEIGVDMLEAMELITKTKCGFATINNVNSHTIENRMESFFLAETTKYLYLLFDPDNFILNNGSIGTVIQTPNGECVIDAGGYFFNTEAHPVDIASIYCCSAQKKEDDEVLQEWQDNLDLLAMLDIVSPSDTVRGKKLKDLKEESEILKKKLKEEKEKLKAEEDLRKFHELEEEQKAKILLDSSEDSDNNKEETENTEQNDDLNIKEGINELSIESSNIILDTKEKQADDSQSQSDNTFDGKKESIKETQRINVTVGQKTENVTSEQSESGSDTKLNTVQNEKLSDVKLSSSVKNGSKMSVNGSASDENKNTELSGKVKDEKDAKSESEILDNLAANNAFDKKNVDAEKNSEEKSLDNNNVLEKDLPEENINTDSKDSEKVSLLEKRLTDLKEVLTLLDEWKLNVKPSNEKTEKKEKSKTEFKFGGSNLEKLFELVLGSENKNKNPKSPNISNLYNLMHYYPLIYESKPELMTCKAQPFHMRMSVLGEMFTDDKN